MLCRGKRTLAAFVDVHFAACFDEAAAEPTGDLPSADFGFSGAGAILNCHHLHFPYVMKTINKW